jgi:hypothetical protein
MTIAPRPEQLSRAAVIPGPAGAETASRGPRRPAARHPRVGEEAESYPRLVAVLGIGCRVIECQAGIQWVIQTKQGSRWHCTSFCRTREAVLRLTASGHPGLLALPARFPEKGTAS